MTNRKSKRSRSSAKSRAKRRVLPHNSSAPVRKSSAKMGTPEKSSNFYLPHSLKKRGRKPKVRISEICNRAYDLTQIFEVNRPRLNWDQLLSAQCDEDLEKALSGAFERAKQVLLCEPELLLSVLRDKQFPKQSREAQEQFIADSLAALGRVSIRRSRDIVQRERSARNRRGKILRREFYIECSRKCEGPAYRDACPRCGAQVCYWDLVSGFAMPGLDIA